MDSLRSQQIADTILSLPQLLFDAPFSLPILTENRPYRNIGDLLVRQAPSVRQALRLCGAAEEVVCGAASDYECFAALCIAAPMLSGHTVMQNISKLLLSVFGLETPLSPYVCESLWDTLNAEIEERCLRPSDIASLLSVESICYRIDPLSAPPTLDFPGVDLYPLPDFGDTPTALLTSPSIHAESLDEFLATLDRQLTQYAEQGAVSVRLGLPYRYGYRRNSKRKELDDAYRFCRTHTLSELSPETREELETALAVAIATFCKEKELTLLLAPDCHVDEVTALYRYLSLNRAVPETVLYHNDPAQWVPFVSQFTFRSERGLPGILLLADRLAEWIPHFPIGTALLPCHAVTDPIALAGTFQQRQALAEMLDALGEACGIDEEILCSLAEDLVYANVKNRFGI